MTVTAAALTHVGRRTNNEDAMCTAPALGLYIVADGLGGYDGGEVASSLAIGAMCEFIARQQRDPEATWPSREDPDRTYDESLLGAAARVAHKEIVARRAGELRGMASTVVATLVKEDRLVVAHVGDSRLYRLRKGQLEVLTRDHSFFNELQSLGAEFERASFPYKNQITRALGLDGANAPDVATYDVEPGDTFLLCSDGLYDPLDEARLRSALELEPQEACAQLVRDAYEAGGTDNITGVVLRAN